MRTSAGKLLLLIAILLLCPKIFHAQTEPASLKDIKKVIFNINWQGNVSPYDIGVNADSLFESFQFLLTEGSLLEEVLDGRGINAGSNQIPLLTIEVQIQTFLTDYIFYFVSEGLLENVQFERLENKSYQSISWINQNYNAFEKDQVGENLKALMSDLHFSFVNAYNKDNGLD